MDAWFSVDVDGSICINTAWGKRFSSAVLCSALLFCTQTNHVCILVVVSMSVSTGRFLAGGIEKKLEMSLTGMRRSKHGSRPRRGVKLEWRGKGGGGRERAREKSQESTIREIKRKREKS